MVDFCYYNLIGSLFFLSFLLFILCCIYVVLSFSPVFILHLAITKISADIKILSYIVLLLIWSTVHLPLGDEGSIWYLASLHVTVNIIKMCTNMN